jgi:hypothetical protein
MSNYIATVIDTTGIQRYIFGSNRLKENIGASHLVKLATKEWVEECLNKLGNVYIPDEEGNQLEPHINEDNMILAELIYSGGGNTILLFKNLVCAQNFTRLITKKVLKEAPGLNIVIAHEAFDWNQRFLQEVLDNDLIKGKLEKLKRKSSYSVPLLGLGVTANCISSGLPAVEMREIDGLSRPISREIAAKYEMTNQANSELRKIIFDEQKLRKRYEQYKIPVDVDDLGRTQQESSYIAVVHADGNQMGKRFQKLGEKYSNNKDNKGFIIAMRQLSWAVNKAAKDALKAVGELLVNSIDSEMKVNGYFQIKDRYLPFRPIVYGGDDVTFVCDGRLGLALAAKFLKEFEKLTENLPDGKGKATACAGIAIVKTHYPFAQAYKLSEELCSSAKKLVREQTDNYSDKKQIFSALDWHIAASGLMGSINDIRTREYQVPEGKLNTRPIQANHANDYWLNWDDFAQIIRKFNEEEPWKDKRNKIIDLREVLRQGTVATQQFLNAYGIESLPEFTSANSFLKTQGWIDGVCYYFDAIEAMEFYVPLGE